MINAQRPAQIPTYLLSSEIKAYIDEAILHMTNPEINPKPTKPVPYRNSDLLEAFDAIFHSKCYLTELKSENSWEMEIEHFLPQSERPDLVYDWNNLFPADGNANRMKPKSTPAGGYLNPCDPADDVESEIFYTLSAYGEDPSFEPQDPNNIKSVNTCNLLRRLHHGHNHDTNRKTDGLRHAIHKKYILILQTMLRWKDPDPQKKAQAARELRELLSRKSSFTMLCRSIPSVLNDLPANEFFD